jgi:hypothetical protein
MASMIARLRASCPKPETIPAGTTTDISLALQLAEAVATVSSALCDRATLPILQWDAKLDGAARKIAYRDWMDSRGRKREPNTPDPIDAQAAQAEAYLARLRPGGEMGKSENPRFVDSGNGSPLDAPHVVTSYRSDDWTRAQLPPRTP